MQGVDGDGIVGVGVACIAVEGGVIDRQQLQRVHIQLGYRIYRLVQRLHITHAPVTGAAEREEGDDAARQARGLEGHTQQSVL